jgi:hypothetical protein
MIAAPMKFDDQLGSPPFIDHEFLTKQQKPPRFSTKHTKADITTSSPWLPGDSPA